MNAGAKNSLKNNFDVIIIGAGSVGLPCAWALSEKKYSVLIIDKNASPGQGQNKAAIGGIRATHSDPAKIQTCKISLDVFASWKEKYGYDMGWQQGGYTFPVWDKSEKTLKDLLLVQHKYGLDISWLSGKEMLELIPDLNSVNLRGGTYSPGDGNVCPLMSSMAFFTQAKKNGARFLFNENVTEIKTSGGKFAGVRTEKDFYSGKFLIVATGADAGETGAMLGIKIPVNPDSHEAGITEPVAKFLKPMVVDMRPGPQSKNFYFYQNNENQIVFCLSHDPIIPGHNIKSTSVFLPQVAKRLIEVMPKLLNIKIRRTWRGLYPMTPDGNPIVDKIPGCDNGFMAVGLCGQGLMLGPGIALNIAEMISNGNPVVSKEIFSFFRFDRDYKAVELLK